MAKFTPVLEMEEDMEPAEPPTCSLSVDGSSGEKGSGVRVVLVSLEEHKLVL